MTQVKKDRIVCLFGSGISAPAKIPMTDDITKRILPLGDFRRGDDMLFELCGPDERRPLGWMPELFRVDEVQEQRNIRTVVNTVLDVITQARGSFSDQAQLINYEDLAFALDRLWRLESHRAFDPLAAVMRNVVLDSLGAHPDILQQLGDILGTSEHCLI
ncbi:MAG: hypothetical protein HZB43_04445, partial [candidate division Zixibacteria bacterium]|nr:hypothetical protein [candidate division Zixibacteria bacterium]